MALVGKIRFYAVMTLKVLIVDHERRERTSLAELCEQRADTQVVDEGQSLQRAQLQFQSSNHRSTPDKLQFLVGERQHRLYPLDVEKIEYIEAHGNYVTIRSGNCDYIRRDSIKRLAECLAERGYVRIERSLLMNARAVAYAQVAGHGTFAFTLASGACIQSSATYRETILDVLPLVPLSRRNERHATARRNLPLERP